MFRVLRERVRLKTAKDGNRLKLTIMQWEGKCKHVITALGGGANSIPERR